MSKLMSEEIVPRTVCGEQLICQLKAVPNVTMRYATFDTDDRAAMQDMIRILLNSAYMLQVRDGVRILEGSVYELNFWSLRGYYPNKSHYPDGVRLRYLTDGRPESNPQFILAYRLEEMLIPYGRPVFGTRGPDAQKVVRYFRHEQPGTPYEWIPLFGQNWLPL